MTKAIHDCCSSTRSKPTHQKKHQCPVCSAESREVSPKTISQHVKQPWKLDDQERKYYFCDSSDCDVVDFGDDDLVFHQSEVRTKIGIKDKSDDAMLCYCFGVTQADVEGDFGIKTFVVAQTKHGFCSCETRNPSGLCCLKNFPR